MEIKTKKFKWIINRLKNREIKLKTAMLFSQPYQLTHANFAIKELEKRKNKKYSKKDYRLILEKLSSDEIFLTNCNIYEVYKNTFVRPSLTYKIETSINERYHPLNLKVVDLKKKVDKNHNKSFKICPYAAMHRQLKVSPGLEFLKQFDDIEKLRFLFSKIKNHNSKIVYNFTKEEKINFIKHFYNDKNFNTFYKKYKETGNKFYKPSLDHKTPRCLGGTNELKNLHFISYLENIAKNDMNMEEWNDVKANINDFFI